MTTARRNLTGVAINGAMVTLTLQVLGQVATIGSTMVVARMLNPGAYGIVGLALLIGLPLTGLVDLGLTQALSRAPNLTERGLHSAFWATCAGASAGLIVGIPVGLLFAHRFGVSGNASLVVTGVAGSLLAVPAAAPRAILGRSFKFRRLALTDFFGQVATGGVSLVLALAGAGAWALILGIAARSIAVVVSSFALSDYRPKPIFDWPELKPLCKFGARAAVSGTTAFLGRSIDDYIVVRSAGSAALGLYRIGFGVALMPFAYLGVAIANIVVPVYAAVADDRDRLGAGLVRGVRYLAVLNTTLIIVLWWLAELAIRVIYGGRFISAVPILRILCITALVYPLGALCGSTMLAIGRAGVELRLSVMQAVLTGFFAFGGWKLDGLEGIAWGVSLYAVGQICVDLVVTARVTRVDVWAIAHALAPAAISGSAAFAGLYALERTHSIGLYMRLPIAAAATVGMLALARLVSPELALHHLPRGRGQKKTSDEPST